MKPLLFCVICLTAYTAVAVPNEYKYPRYYNYSDGNGLFKTLDLEEELDVDLLDEMARNPANNQYLLYTRRNPSASQPLHINNVESITSSYFNPAKPTIVIAHGWLSNQNSEPNPSLRSAYLRRDDVNIIVMDWRRLSMSTYSTAAKGVPNVGRSLGQFLNFLNRVTGAPFNNIHLIGFSLGAHLVGNAGRELEGKIARITGLDPAGPLWSFNKNRLTSSDAIYVEAIHTDGGYTVGGLGIGFEVGDVDFFPNGGISQPGCYHNVCNHQRAWKYFAATVTYNHLKGKLCTSKLQISLNSCRGKALEMGNGYLNKRGSGIFRVNTRARYPF